MTFRRHVWLLLRNRPSDAAELAKRYRLDYDKVAGAFRGLRDAGAIELVERKGRVAVYRVTGDEPLDEGRGRSLGSAEGRKLGPGSRPKVRRMATPNEQRLDIPRKDGYGSGKLAIEEAWPVRVAA